MASQVEYITAFATVVGCIEALRQVQQKARRQEHRTRKNNLVVHCTKSSRFSPMLEGKHVVLSGDKLYIDTGTEWEFPSGHPACCFYHPFPGTQFEGLVTTICDEPPILNWVYVDRGTYEVKFGTKPWAEKNFKVSRNYETVRSMPPGKTEDSRSVVSLTERNEEERLGTGSFDDSRLAARETRLALLALAPGRPAQLGVARGQHTLPAQPIMAAGKMTPIIIVLQDTVLIRMRDRTGWEGFVAVQEGHFWALYFDAPGDRLASKVPEGTPVLEIELRRIEMRVSKPVIPEDEKQDGTRTEQQQKEERQAGCTPVVRLESPAVD